MLNPAIAVALDVIVLISSVWMAIAERGTIVGWLFTGIVIWWVLAIIRAIKNTFED
jgi:hypothetical protein